MFEIDELLKIEIKCRSRYKRINDFGRFRFSVHILTQDQELTLMCQLHML